MLYARLLAALAVCALVKLGSCLSAPKGAAGKGRQREKQEAQWTRTGIVALRDAGIKVHNAGASAVCGNAALQNVLRQMPVNNLAPGSRTIAHPIALIVSQLKLPI